MSEGTQEGKIVISPMEAEELKKLNMQLQSLFTNLGYLDREISKISKKKEEVMNNMDATEQKINSMSDIIMKNYSLDPNKTWHINWDSGEVIEVNLQSKT